MIRKNKDEIGLECNLCGAEIWGGTLEFREAIHEAQNEGWKFRKDGDEWIHTCPDCEEDE